MAIDPAILREEQALFLVVQTAWNELEAARNAYGLNDRRYNTTAAQKFDDAYRKHRQFCDKQGW